MKICICGGGNLGHVTAGFLSSQEKLRVSLLTSRPEQWSRHLEVIDNDGRTFRGKLDKISSDPKLVVPDADMILVCLPGFAIHDVLVGIEPFLNRQTWVGTVVSSTGFFFEAMKVLPKGQPLFGFQRVPFISRIVNYGHVAELKGYKESLSVAVEQTKDKETVRWTLEHMFKTPTRLLGSYYEASLSNSNPLLHTSRLYTMWKDWEPGMSYNRNPGFYTEWTEETSELYINMDEEFQLLLDKLNIQDGCIPSVLKYYESEDAKTLTKKISSIPAFQGILSPMILNRFGMYEPDFSSRYFTEDFSYGLRFIIETSQQQMLRLPLLEKVYNWGINIVKRT